MDDGVVLELELLLVDLSNFANVNEFCCCGLSLTVHALAGLSDDFGSVAVST